MTKEKLAQYIDLQAEQKENEERINTLERQIAELDEKIRKIVEDGTVIDSVTGGDGGIQRYKIEGFPYREYDSKIARLQLKRDELKARKNSLAELNKQIAAENKEIYEFIDGVESPHIRRILRARYEDGKSWQQIAIAVGGGNTDDSVRKCIERFLGN